MDITFDDIVVHETINDIGGFALSGANDVMMPEEVALIDEGVDADPRVLPKILKGIGRIE